MKKERKHVSFKNVYTSESQFISVTSFLWVDEALLLPVTHLQMNASSQDLPWSEWES